MSRIFSHSLSTSSSSSVKWFSLSRNISVLIPLGCLNFNSATRDLLSSSIWERPRGAKYQGRFAHVTYKLSLSAFDKYACGSPLIVQKRMPFLSGMFAIFKDLMLSQDRSPRHRVIIGYYIVYQFGRGVYELTEELCRVKEKGCLQWPWNLISMSQY